MKYGLLAMGYSDGPEFSTLTEARKAMSERIAQDMKECKARYGCAFKRAGKDSAQILIGTNAQAFNVWSAYAIAKLWDSPSR